MGWRWLENFGLFRAAEFRRFFNSKPNADLIRNPDADADTNTNTDTNGETNANPDPNANTYTSSVCGCYCDRRRCRTHRLLDRQRSV